METHKNLQNRKLIKSLLIVTLVTTAAFWIVANSFNVYTYKVTGAIFEMLSVPMLLLTIASPIVALVFFFKDINIRSPFLYIAVVSTTLALCLFLLG